MPFDSSEFLNPFAPVQFDGRRRLYQIASDGLPTDLMVESFQGIESISATREYQIDVLRTEPIADLSACKNRQAALGTRLAEGGLDWRSGYVRQIQQLEADGGLHRYRLWLVSGDWYAALVRKNRIFQNQSLQSIIEHILQPYAPYIRLQYATGLDTWLSDLPERPMVLQYQQTDHDFLNQLCAEEGLHWLVRETPSAQSADPHAPPDFTQGACHTLTLQSDSHAYPQDCSSQAHQGIPWQRNDALEQRDSIVALHQQRRLQANRCSSQSWDWHSKRSLVASESSASRPAHIPLLDRWMDAQDARQQTTRQAAHYTRLAQQNVDQSQWQITLASSVRSFAIGHWFNLTNYSSDAPQSYPQEGDSSVPASHFNLLQLIHVGINNLPRTRHSTLTQHLHQQLIHTLQQRPSRHSAIPALDWSTLAHHLPTLIEQASATGYANLASILPRALLLRAWQPRQYTVPPGFNLPAQVVGPQGETEASQQEIHADAHNRVRVRFYWQQGDTPGDQSSAWVPVLQRVAGPTRGAHYLPRIGQEVMVGFHNNQLDQPIILTSVYNGRGEGSPFSSEDHSPAVQTDPSQDPPKKPAPPGTASPFSGARDHRSAGQGNRASGNSPAWHGAAAEHQHNAALLGIRTKEWGGKGYNQLLFDDSDQQLAVQAATSQYTAQLNLGHLRHRADNYRGSFRGQGFEVRSDAYGVIRSRQGLLLSTWGRSPDTPTADAAAPMRLYASARNTGANLNQAASRHQSVPLTTVAGVSNTHASNLRAERAPLAALHHAASGMVNARQQPQALQDAQQNHTTAQEGQIPHSTDALLTLAGRGGIGLTAKDIQFASGQTQTCLSGQHHYTAVQGQSRLHTGQAIGLLGGVIRADGPGVQVIAGNDDITVQAQSDHLQVASQQDLSLHAGSEVHLVAAKKVIFQTTAGALLEIGGDINVLAPGALTIHASSHQFVQGTGEGYAAPHLPRAELKSTDMEFRLVDPWGRAVAQAAYKATLSDGTIRVGHLDREGYACLTDVPEGSSATIQYLRDERVPASEVSLKTDADFQEFLAIPVPSEYAQK